MTTWEFTLFLNRQITEEETAELDTSDDLFFARGDMPYTVGGPGPSTVMCSIEAPTLLDAVAEAAAEVRGLPGLRAVQVERNELVDLEEVAARTSRRHQSLVELAHERGDFEGFPQPEWEVGGRTFYSWAKVADFLRGLGDDVEPVPQDLLIADRALRLAAALEGREVSAAVLRGLGVAAA